MITPVFGIREIAKALGLPEDGIQRIVIDFNTGDFARVYVQTLLDRGALVEFDFSSLMAGTPIERETNHADE